MKKILLTILAVAAMAFVGCSKDDDKTIDNLAEKLKGKWMIADRDGQAALTNEKSVLTVLSATEALLSTSRENYSSTALKWSAYLECSVAIDGNKVTITGHPNEHITIINELNIHSITTTKMEVTFKLIMKRDGEIVRSRDPIEMRYEKVTTDYKDAVLAKWECTGLTGIETYNDANAQLEFYQDGTYNYWRKNGDQWEAVTNREFQNYFVDGTLLATRWKNQGEEELREWWEIASIAGNEMEWTALRKKEDGTTVTQTMTWVKVN